MVYRFLLYTGLRRSEADQLRWGYVHLDVANPHVEIPAAITKSGRPERVPLVPEVAASLRELREGASPSQSVFGEIPSMHLFRKDLEAAGIPEADERGRKVVRHSLRHSLATMLAQSKMPPAIAQQIMRHSDIQLTLRWYTDEGLLPTGGGDGFLPERLGVLDAGVGPELAHSVHSKWPATLGTSALVAAKPVQTVGADVSLRRSGYAHDAAMLPFDAERKREASDDEDEANPHDRRGRASQQAPEDRAGGRSEARDHDVLEPQQALNRTRLRSFPQGHRGETTSGRSRGPTLVHG